MGEIMGHIDVAQITLYVFWLFFFLLIVYLRQEDRREGYPLESDTSPGKLLPPSLVFFPPPKSFRVGPGQSVSAPHPSRNDTRVPPGKPTAPWPGAPLTPTGANPMLDSIGPGSWAERADRPDVTADQRLRIVPIRIATAYAPSARDGDPRGYAVVGADRVVAGTVVDLWIDRAEHLLRYFEVELAGLPGKRILLPINFSDIQTGAKRVQVDAILGGQFADVPATRSPDSVTLLEEEKICAYFGAGTLYATPSRAEPLI